MRITGLIITFTMLLPATTYADLVSSPIKVGNNVLNAAPPTADVEDIDLVDGDAVSTPNSYGFACHLVGAETAIFYQFEVNESVNDAIELGVTFWQDSDGVLDAGPVPVYDAAADGMVGPDFFDTDFNSGGANQDVYQWTISGISPGDLICAEITHYADFDNGAELFQFSTTAIPEASQAFAIGLLGLVFGVHKLTNKRTLLP